MKPKLEINLIATTYGGGPGFYHPAIRNMVFDIWYWPNVTFETEALAYKWAQESLNRLIAEHLKPAQEIINGWNIFHT